MAQRDNEHLTIEQLSAFLDKRLFPEEEAECDAHLRTCQRCQSLLADLRQTVGLLRALPEPELPRSFVLPANARRVAEGSVRPDAPASVIPITRGHRRSWQSYLQRSTRVMGTIAAVLGIFFILSGLITGLPHGGGATTTSAPSSASNLPPMATPAKANTPHAATPLRTPHGTATHDERGANPQTPGASRSPTPASTGTAVPNTFQPNNQHKFNQVPPILDVSMPEGRIGVGSILLILGMLGVLFARRRQASSS